MVTLENLLEDLHDDGETESSGVFTLDPKKAREKLQNFAFVSPDDYLPKLVQAGVAAGASQIEVEVNASIVELLFRDLYFEKDQVQGLMNYLLVENCPPEWRPLRHLAAGLRGSLAVEPGLVWWESWSDGKGYQRRWSDQDWNLKELERSEQQGRFSRFHLVRQAGKRFRLAFSSLFQSKEHERPGLLRRCAYLAQPLTLNGEPIKRAEFGRPRYPGYRIELDENPGESRPPPYLASDQLVEGLIDKHHHLAEVYPTDDRPTSLIQPPHSQATLKTLTGGPCRAWLGLEAQLEKTARITYIEDGVVLETRELELGIPGLVGIYSAEGLPKDLTGFSLVEGEAYRAHLDWLRQQGQVLKETVLANLESIPTRVSTRRQLS